MGGWSAYGHVITKFSRMDRFTKLWGYAHLRVELGNQIKEKPSLISQGKLKTFF